VTLGRECGYALFCPSCPFWPFALALSLGTVFGLGFFSRIAPPSWFPTRRISVEFHRGESRVTFKLFVLDLDDAPDHFSRPGNHGSFPSILTGVERLAAKVSPTWVLVCWRGFWPTVRADRCAFRHGVTSGGWLRFFCLGRWRPSVPLLFLGSGSILVGGPGLSSPATVKRPAACHSKPKFALDPRGRTFSLLQREYPGGESKEGCLVGPLRQVKT